MRTLLIALVLGALAWIVFPAGGVANGACRTGEAQGFAALRFSPPYTAGTIPNRWVKARRYFWRSYNCSGGGVFVRRVNVGVYAIHFPHLGYRMALVSAVTQDGTTASVEPIGNGVFWVILRGPIVGDGLLQRRDVAFSIAVY